MTQLESPAKKNWQSVQDAMRGGLTVSEYMERRIVAAALDALLVSICCLVLFMMYGPINAKLPAWVGNAAAGVLAVYALLELLTGITPGKILRGLSVRAVDGSRPPFAWLLLRGFVKLVPVFFFLPLLLAANPIAMLAELYLFVLVASSVLIACYLFMMRRGKSLYDAVSKTAVAWKGNRPHGTN